MATADSPMGNKRESSRRYTGLSPWLVAAVFLALVALTAFGHDYYFADAGDRLRHPNHKLLGPSGTLGLALGFAALAGLLFLWLYPLRKRLGVRRGLGPVGGWLDVHVGVGLVLPLLAAVHGGWRFNGLIGLGYFSMLLVAISGLIGRYLYTRIPRSQTGTELNREGIASQRRKLVVSIAGHSGLQPEEIRELLNSEGDRPPPRGALAGLLRAASDDLNRRKLVRRLEQQLRRRGQNSAALPWQEIRALARRELALAQRLAALEQLRRIFGWWHVAHRPLAIMALLAVLAHVAVAILFSMGWGS